MNGRWVEVRDQGKFLFQYDPLQRRVRIVRGGREYVADLAQYEQALTGNVTSETAVQPAANEVA